jgi:hypothetical protein
MFRPVASFIAVFAIINIAASCGNDPYTYRECEVTGDCHQPTQQIPGTICDDDQCRCEDPDQVICCKFGDKRENCPQACRDCLECAEGTPECPTYECHVNEDCKERRALCFTSRSCEQGKCVYTPYPGRALNQKVGDCAELICRSDGTYVREPDPQDVLQVVNTCSWVNCDGIDELLATAVDGQECPTGFCVGGRCVQCYRSEDCNTQANEACVRGKCVSAECSDGVLNGPEIDIDCGGSNCAPCADGRRCGGDADCASEVCVNQRCAPPAVGDGRINGTETGRDCGGPSAPPCGDFSICLFHRDCESDVCLRGLCQKASCDDGTQNQGEVGPDCGGPCPLLCL